MEITILGRRHWFAHVSDALQFLYEQYEITVWTLGTYGGPWINNEKTISVAGLDITVRML